MVTDPNYTKPPHLNVEYFKQVSIDYMLMVIRELSGSDGEQPQAVAAQVAYSVYIHESAHDHIEAIY